ncbi:keratin, type II cytoskeletal 8-like [Trichomycterus rosablanca]|uniref:keratin, type II cytoskeletal 8-like n=1 Tax=Trichomycterus rosablanca TaxID=2290929 RepID=UPI002F35DC9C
MREMEKKTPERLSCVFKLAYGCALLGRCLYTPAYASSLLPIVYSERFCLMPSMAENRGNPGFSSQSYSPSSSRGYPSVPPTNPNLLNPLESKVDTQDAQAKTKEKDQMVGLNDKFVALIDKVSHLEEENKALETHLNILLEHDKYKDNIDDLVKENAAELKRQIDGLALDKKKLETDLVKCKEELKNTTTMYKDEVDKKTNLENEFVINKRDLDDGFLQKVLLELELEDIIAKLDFLKNGYDEEIKELESMIHNETVVLKPDNSRNLDVDEILQEVKAKYEEMAKRSREEAEQWNKRRMNDMVLKAGKHEQEVKDIKREITVIQRSLQKQITGLGALKKKKRNLEDEIGASELENQRALNNAQDHISKLEEALCRDKQLMVRQVREYQELMNLKLALDIEIATYKKLLEGEEMRMADHQRNQSDIKASKIQPSLEPAQENLKVLLIKIEVKEGRIISESTEVLEGLIY